MIFNRHGIFLEQFSGRTLGHVAKHKKKRGRYEQEGRRLFILGMPCPYGWHNDYGRSHCMERGWRRAWMESQKGKVIKLF